MSRQCALVGVSRSSLYYRPKGESAENLALMRRLDELHGVSVLRQPAADAASAPRGRHCGPTPYPAAHAPDGDGGNLPAAAHERGESAAPGLPISCAACRSSGHVPVTQGFFYLVAVMDWATRHVLAWRLSNTMDASFCVEALDDAWAGGHRRGTPIKAPSSPARPDRVLRAWRSRWTAGAASSTTSSSSGCGVAEVRGRI